jgi:hypothetical protein
VREVGHVIELYGIYQLGTVAGLKLFFWVPLVSHLAGEKFGGHFRDSFRIRGAVSVGSCAMGADWLVLGSPGSR